MDVRLKNSGNGARWYGLITQGTFAGALAIGYFDPPADQSTTDRSLSVVIPFVIVALVMMMLRTVFVGIYFGRDHIRVRSWWRTYTIPLSGRPRFDGQAWYPVISRGIESGFYRELSATWIQDGFRRSHRFPVLVSHHRRSLEQIALINEFVSAWLAAPSPSLARDFARGSSRKASLADVRLRRGRRISTVLEYFGLVEFPESPPPRKRNSRHARVPVERP